MKWAYTFGIQIYSLALKLASIFHAKAKHWVKGREKWRDKLKNSPLSAEKTTIWFHCASLGEFEQGRNLIEAIKQTYPKAQILLTFFSPSGYEIRKNYVFADYVMYLPEDTPQNAKDFIALANPKYAFFIKYEIWLNYLSELSKQHISTYLVAARIRENSPFLRKITQSLYQKAFLSFTKIFTQDEITKQLLTDFCHHHDIVLSSDTRYDRVYANRIEFQSLPLIEQFKQDKICIICGSSWEKEEEMMLEIFPNLPENVVLIFAPHEIHADKITKQIERFSRISIRYSQIKDLNEPILANQLIDKRILWIDNIGLLSKLYFYADFALVGGGFRNALHNILEPATFGSIIFFGPQHKKFPEAAELISEGIAYQIENATQLAEILHTYLSLNNLKLREELQRLSEKNRFFVEKRKGATAQILAEIQFDFS